MKKSLLTTAVVNVLYATAFTVASAGGSAADASPRSTTNSAAGSLSRTEDALASLQARFGDSLVLVGQIDAISDSGEAVVLGQRVIGSSTTGLFVGDYIAVLGQPAIDGRVDASLVYQLTDSYVPGASRVLIRGIPTSDPLSNGFAQLGYQVIDLTPAMSRTDVAFRGEQRSVLSVTGIQPLPGGVVLAWDATANGSLGTGKANGSLGTGKVDGSLGTGRSSNGSLGTGKANGSLGTGKVDGSLGTG